MESPAGHGVPLLDILMGHGDGDALLQTFFGAAIVSPDGVVGLAACAHEDFAVLRATSRPARNGGVVVWRSIFADPMTMMHAVHGAVLAVLCRAVHSEICRALLHARLEEAAAELPATALMFWVGACSQKGTVRCSNDLQCILLSRGRTSFSGLKLKGLLSLLGLQKDRGVLPTAALTGVLVAHGCRKRPKEWNTLRPHGPPWTR
mmetsp:Transcript_16702/g.28424  ORF Transcript_16702/g.28424 Transcript_16702/m.28424 type:complete len:205 (-) Transcript_16702:58-672(-)